ncbi:MAG TPA: radical SAM protein [Vicinamibacteria bacterium]
MSQPRVVMTSPVQPIGGCSANVYSWDKSPARVRVAMSFLSHPGLAFLGANAGCEVLEYPDAAAFARLLADPPEILGLSFYINETEIALRMAEQARRAGVREVWAGNYGAYSPQVRGAFDRVFEGWAESAVAVALGRPAVPVEGLRHPPLYGAIGTNLFPRMVLSGLMFSSRGCPFTCSFCQTPDFYGRPVPVPLEELERVAWTYRRQGIQGVNLLDENFGTFPGHANAVVDILHRHGLRWIALTRVDTLLRHFDEWSAKGLFGAHLGIESLNEASLQGASKRIQGTDSVRLLERMGRSNMFVQCFYILGFEEDTVESVRSDVERLAALDVDVVQVQVLTPYPRTGQRAQIEARYGIHDRNLSHYNSRNLVWGHPHISPAEMRSLQRWANARLSSSRRALRTLAKFAVFGGRARPGLEGLRLALRPFRGPARRTHDGLASRLRAARAWTRRGWYAYEEFASTEALTARDAPAEGTPPPSARGERAWA